MLNGSVVVRTNEEWTLYTQQCGLASSVLVSSVLSRQQSTCRTTVATAPPTAAAPAVGVSGADPAAGVRFDAWHLLVQLGNADLASMCDLLITAHARWRAVSLILGSRKADKGPWACVLELSFLGFIRERWYGTRTESLCAVA